MIAQWQSLFEVLAEDGETISAAAIERELLTQGLRRDDPRLAGFFSYLESQQKPLDQESFSLAADAGSGVLIERALRGQLVIPEFSSFCDSLSEIFHATAEHTMGKVADYIEPLARVPVDKFAMSVCTIDGQRFAMGDHSELFSLQSVVKPLMYALALEEHGTDRVHCHVGREPSGHSFNEITLDYLRRPHNPMINAGAIMTAGLISWGRAPAERFDYMQQFWSRLAGGVKPEFNNGVYLSERDTADRNFALGYFLRENDVFPPESGSLRDILEFYFQCCSLENSTDSLAVVASTLASAGVCPLTRESIIDPEYVKHTLSLMYTCGMYDFSGEFAFTIGLPAKSGVGGGLMLVVPNVMGIAIWSPPLDNFGNTIRGVEFCRRLLQRYNFHNYDSLIPTGTDKLDPRAHKAQSQLEGVMALCWAAAQGDLREIGHLLFSGVDVNSCDYDKRTALHLAAADGHVRLVKYLLKHGANPHLKDRWGHLAKDDAKRAEQKEVLKVLKDWEQKVG